MVKITGDWCNAEAARPDPYKAIVMYCENYLGNAYQVSGFTNPEGEWMQSFPWRVMPNQNEIKFWKYSEPPFLTKEALTP